MPCFLESGRVQLSADEVDIYRVAAARLRDVCETMLDLHQPMTSDEWIVLQVADAALQGHIAVLDEVIAAVETSIQSRRRAA